MISILILITFLLFTLLHKTEFRGLIIFGLILRIFLASISFGFEYNLPDSGDGLGFRARMAEFMYSNPIDDEGFGILSSINLYPSVMAYIATIIGSPVLLVVITLNIWSGMYMLKIISDFVARNSNRDNGKIALILLLVSPTLAVYSANLLRESYFTLFLSFGLINIYQYTRSSQKRELFKGILFILLSAALHIGAIITLVPVVFILVQKRKINLTMVALTIVIIVIAMGFSRIGNDKIMSVYRYFSGESEVISLKAAQYSGKLLERSDIYFFSQKTFGAETQILYLIPKVIEYLSRPNIFDVNGYYEVFKVYETFLFLWLLIKLCYEIKGGRSNILSQLAFYSVVCMIIVFGSYSNDLNQGHRHKLKALPLLVLGLTFKSKNATNLRPFSKPELKKG